MLFICCNKFDIWGIGDFGGLKVMVLREVTRRAILILNLKKASSVIRGAFGGTTYSRISPFILWHGNNNILYMRIFTPTKKSMT